jgi:hypothetical protein
MSYIKPDSSLSYLLTKDGAEVDLIYTEPGKPDTLIEIKSKAHVDDRDIRHLLHFQEEFPDSQLYLLSQDKVQKKIMNVDAFFWQSGILEILGLKV